MINRLTQYKLNSVLDRKSFNDICGIYALVYDNEIIYIGQSMNIGNRLRQHNGAYQIEETLRKIKKEQGNCNRTKQLALYMFIDEHREDINFIIIGTCAPTELDDYEKEYISRYKPIFNYKGVLA